MSKPEKTNTNHRKHEGTENKLFPREHLFRTCRPFQ
jgi:hypothetical protein